MNPYNRKKIPSGKKSNPAKFAEDSKRVKYKLFPQDLQ